MSANCASGTWAPVEVVAHLARVAHVDGVARPPFDRPGHGLAADRRQDHHLRLVHGQAVTRQLIAPQVEIQEVAAGGPLREAAAGFGKPAQRRFDLQPHPLDDLEIGPENLDPDRGPDAGVQHVETRLDRHRPGVGDPGELQAVVEIGDQIVT
jgi:hypothetical protein